MQLFHSSSSSLKLQFNLFTPTPNADPEIFFSKLPIKPLPSPLVGTSLQFSRESSPSLDEKLLLSQDSDDENEEEEGGNLRGESPLSGLLLARRPVLDIPGRGYDNSQVESGEEEVDDRASIISYSSPIDLGLSEVAKKMQIFEPKRVGVSSSEKPLAINLELALYRAKVMARKFKFEEAEKILRQCISIWPEDGRLYVALGKILSKQSKTREARLVYERGCQATQGENSYIWQCWAVLENKIGNIRKARQLFDAATVADKRHVAAWHGWAVLELDQGNIKKARSLLGKGLKYCGGNEYIYQTLALLEARGNRIEQARYLFRQATLCNPRSCASWLSWAQVEMRQENHLIARKLFEKSVQASPKNRFAWHVWGVFEASQGDIEKGKKLLKIGHALNPRDPVLLQSLALLEYRHSSTNLARALFKRASELDPKHQPVWVAWGWMEWKEGNLTTARDFYQKALSIDSTSDSAARCLQAWGVLEQRTGNLSAARRLFRSSLNINSQSYVTWMTWASLEEQLGNAVRAEEIRNLYFQQRTEVVDDASWVLGFGDIIDPALDNMKKFLRLDSGSDYKMLDALTRDAKANSVLSEGVSADGSYGVTTSDFDLDRFIKEKLSLDASKLDEMERFKPQEKKSRRRIWQSEVKKVTMLNSSS